MKKLLAYLFMFTFLFGCEKPMELEETPIPEPDETPETEMPETILETMPETIYASVTDDDDDAQTKTYTDGSRVLWHNGDEISYFAQGVHNTRYQFNGSDGSASAEFTKVSGTGVSGDDVRYTHAVYPYYSKAAYTRSDDKETITAFYSGIQYYAPGSFGKGANVMYAVGTSENEADQDLFFRNACGYIVFKLYGSGIRVRTITLTARKDRVQLSGEAIIETTSGDEPVITMVRSEFTNPSHAVTLYCGDDGVELGEDAASATEFWLALPPVTFKNGFEIEVTDVDGAQYVKKTTKEVSIIRNKVQPMAAFHCVPATPPDNQLWYNTFTNNMITNVDSDYGGGEEKFYVGETEYFDAAITAHYYDESIGRFVIEFDKALTTIKDNAFYRNDLSQISLPESLVTIGDAFYGTTLKSICIPGNVKTIDGAAFQACSYLESIVFEPGDEPLAFYTDAGYQLSPFYNSNLRYINIDRDVVITPDDDITLLNGGGLFHQRLKTENTVVVLGDNVTSISNGMFRNLGMSDITIPNSVKSIGTVAFAECDNLTSITIPGGVESISPNAFYNCTALSEVDFQTGDEPLKIGYQVLNRGADYEYGPFYDSPLESITLDRELIYMDDYGQEFTPDGWEEGLFANKFYDDVASVSVSLGNNVKTLSKYMFNYLSIREITIPGNVTLIEDLVFDGCENLERITFEASDEELKIGIQDEVSDVGPFYDSPLNYVYLGRNLISTDDDLDATDEGVFSNRFRLPMKVDFGGSFTKILPYMFSKTGVGAVQGANGQLYDSPGSLWLTNTITSIGSYAFDDCDKLSTLRLGYDGLTDFPTIGENVFDGCDNTIRIIVRKRVYDRFMSDESDTFGWKDYKRFIQTESNFE